MMTRPLPQPPTTGPISLAEDAPPARTRWPLTVCVLVAALAMFANYLPALLLGLGAQRLFKGAGGRTAEMLLSLMISLTVLGTAVLLVGWLARTSLRSSLRGIGWRWSHDSWWLALVGWGAATAGIVVAQLLPGLMGLPTRQMPDEPTAALSLTMVLLTIATALGQSIALQGIPEELLWRGWLMNCMASRPRLALVVAAVGFGALHIISHGGQQDITERLVYCLHAVAFALLAGALSLRLRSLWCAIGVHAGMHLTNRVLEQAVRPIDGPWVWGTQALTMTLIALVVLAGWKGNRVRFER